MREGSTSLRAYDEAMERLLTSSTHARALSFALATGPAGYVMGLAFFSMFLPDLPRVREETLPAVAAVPGLLSAGVGWFASRASTPRRAAVRAFGAAVAVSLVCAPLTYAALAILSEPFGAPEDALALALVFVTVYGALVSVPLGGLFGLLFAGQAYVLARLLRARAGGDAAWVSVGLGWIAVCALASGPDIFALFAPSPGLDAAGVLAALGAPLTLAGVLLCALRRWLLGRARAGALPGLAVVPRREADDLELPRLLPFGRTDHVLVRRARPASGPFREHETAEPVALV